MRTKIMGIINTSPDSFSCDGSSDSDLLIQTAMQMVDDGATIIDVGGESSRPFSEPITPEEEQKRVLSVISGIRRRSNVAISIDTYRAETAQKALDAGATIINDISALSDVSMGKLAAKYNCPIILMHMKGNPQNMQIAPSYSNLLKEVSDFFKNRISDAFEYGISADNIILDVGIGFGKDLLHNIQLIQNIEHFSQLGYPLMIGPSRKSFIGKILNEPVENRIEGTLAVIAASILKHVDIVRVHDVKATSRFVKVFETIFTEG